MVADREIEKKPPGKGNGRERERPMEMAPPKIRRVYSEDWEDLNFDGNTAMKVESLGPSASDENTEIYEFKINMDNIPLKNESKHKRLTKEQQSLLSEQFLYANVLIGLSLLLEDEKTNKSESPDSDTLTETIEERIDSVSRTLAPFIPALVSLGSGDLESDDHLEGLEGIE